MIPKPLLPVSPPTPNSNSSLPNSKLLLTALFHQLKLQQSPPHPKQQEEVNEKNTTTAL